MTVSLIASDWGADSCDITFGFFTEDWWTLTLPASPVAGDLIIATGIWWDDQSTTNPLDGQFWKISDGTETELNFFGFDFTDIAWCAIFRCSVGSFGSPSTRTPSISGGTATYSSSSGDFFRVQLWNAYEYPTASTDGTGSVSGATTAGGFEFAACATFPDYELAGAAMSYQEGSTVGSIVGTSDRNINPSGTIEYRFPVTLTAAQQAYWGILAG